MMNRRTAMGMSGAFACGAMAIGLPAAHDFADLGKDGIAKIRRNPSIITLAGVIDGMLKITDLNPKLKIKNVHVFIPDDSFPGYRKMEVSNFKNKTLTRVIKATAADDSKSISQISIEIMHADHAMERLGVMLTSRNGSFMRKGETRMHKGESCCPNGVAFHVLRIKPSDDPSADTEFEMNRAAKIFGAFVHHVYGKSEPEWVQWIPDWVNGGEYRSDFATRIVADGGKTAEMVDLRGLA